MFDIIGIIFLIIFIGFGILAFKILIQNGKEARENNVIIMNRCQYIGGISKLDEKDFAGNIMGLEVRPDSLFINYEPFITINILLSNIISVEVKTEEQVNEDISLGKLICFGVLSLGMKNKTIEKEYYLIVEYKDINNKNIVFAMKTKNAERFRKAIKQQKGEKYSININSVINK